jgi:hypothetical protein
MRLTPKLLTLAATATFASIASMAQEPPAPTTLQTPATAPAPATVTVPARGSTMESVREKFGAPTQEQPAAGQPPITRWDYPTYSVFFEHDKVLHTVVSR